MSDLAVPVVRAVSDEAPQRTLLARTSFWLTALFCGLELFAPLAALAALGVVWIGAFEESFGYRYFYGLRWLYFADQEIWLPQGQLAGVIHHLINLGLTLAGYPPFDEGVFFQRAVLFTYLAATISSGFMLAGICALLWPISSLMRRALLAAVLLFPLFGWGSRGWQNYIQPDYQPYVLVLYIAALVCAQQLLASGRTISWRLVLATGALAGAAIALKLTLIPIPITLGLLLLYVSGPGWRSARLALVFGVSALGTLIAIVVGQYLWSLSKIVPVLTTILGFAQTMSERDKPTYIDWYLTTFVNDAWPIRMLLLAPVLLAVLYLMGWSRRFASLALILAPSVCWYLYFSYARWETITIFEYMCFGAFAVGLLILQADSHTIGRRVARTWYDQLGTVAPYTEAVLATLLLVSVGLFYGEETARRIDDYIPTSDETKAAWTFVESIPGRHLDLEPNVYFKALILEPAILKGGWVGWNDPRYSSETLGNMFPRRDFLTPGTPRVVTINLSDYDALTITAPAGYDDIGVLRAIGELYEIALGVPVDVSGWHVDERFPLGGKEIVVLRPGSDPAWLAQLARDEADRQVVATERDAQREHDLDTLKRALVRYYEDHGRYPCSPSSWSWSSGGGAWLVDEPSACGATSAFQLDATYLAAQPVDPVNTGPEPWIGGKVYGYGVCPGDLAGHYFMLVTRLEAKASVGRTVHGCDGQLIPWPPGVYAISSGD